LSADLTLFSQNIINGFLFGGFLALGSVGLSLIFGVQRILNVAQGAFIVLASFLTFQFSIIVTPLWHLDPIFSILLDFVAIGVIGGISYFLLIYRIEKSGFEAPLLATFGLSIFIEYVITNGLSFSFSSPFGPFHFSLLPPLNPIGSEEVVVQNTVLTGSITIGPYVISDAYLIAFVIAIIVIPVLHLILSRTYFGKAIRATSQDPQAAEFSGIDIRIARLFSFSLGSALAGVAGGVYVFTTAVTSTAGDVYLLPLILAVIIVGGVGSMFGTLIGGFVIGLILFISDFVAFEMPIPKDLGSVIAFLVFLVVLMVKPTGLLGTGAGVRIFRMRKSKTSRE
jgi:branched-chain amino acid transport system permease protein